MLTRDQLTSISAALEPGHSLTDRKAAREAIAAELEQAPNETYFAASLISKAERDLRDEMRDAEARRRGARLRDETSEINFEDGRSVAFEMAANRIARMLRGVEAEAA
jgi:hypothetical protein